MVTASESIEYAARPNGEPTSYVKGGCAVWTYVLVARSFDWDVKKTAEHLSEPEAHVEAALEHYFASPQEVDARLARMRAIDDDPAKSLPEAVIVTV